MGPAARLRSDDALLAFQRHRLAARNAQGAERKVQGRLGAPPAFAKYRGGSSAQACSRAGAGQRQAEQQLRIEPGAR